MALSPINDNFSLNAPKPIRTTDIVGAGLQYANKEAIPVGMRYPMMLTTDRDTGTVWRLEGGTADINWVEFQSGGIVDLSSYLLKEVVEDSGNYTGFVDGSNIAISYNHTNRTITLTGDLTFYWLGVKKTLASPFTSVAHAATIGSWFLMSVDGISFTWSQSPWSFSHVMVAYVSYKSTLAETFAVRETHGLMDNKAHEEFHQTIGTYRISGGRPTVGTYIENTATDAATQPGFDAAVIKDEDCTTLIPLLTEGAYTKMTIDSNRASVFTLDSLHIFNASGSFIQVNDPLTGAITNGINNRYYNIYQLLIPVTGDSGSQKYRMVFVQPQQTFTTLAAAQSEDTKGIFLGSISDLSAEYTFYTRITYLTANGDTNIGKCRIATGGISYVEGTRASLTSVIGASSTNHANTSNLNWASSGHIGTPGTVAAFDPQGLALERDLSSKQFNQNNLTFTNNVGDYFGTQLSPRTGTLTFDMTGAVTGGIAVCYYQNATLDIPVTLFTNGQFKANSVNKLYFERDSAGNVTCNIINDIVTNFVVSDTVLAGTGNQLYNIVECTQAQYTALGTKNPNTWYFING